MFDHLIEHSAYLDVDASRLLRQVALALDFICRIGVGHADLKVSLQTVDNKNLNSFQNFV